MRLLRMVIVLAALAAPSLAFSDQPQPPADFVPAENESQEQIPAMPLLGAAYGFIWLGVFGYVWSVARRLRKVESEITALEARKR
jgi:CcmD family protein